jgi:hypothetical protein
MNSNCYIVILKDTLLFWMKDHREKPYLQDGASCHTNRKVIAVLKQNEISVMDWLGNSPDFNPTEKLLSLLKGKLKKNYHVTSLPLLIQAFRHQWIALPRALMMMLAKSIPNGIKLCIKNKGQNYKIIDTC